ncbi:MAG: hydrogen gas-evolving membrane-bound hydrogenase subunit E [Spirochaetaceae bacterium]
MRTFAVRVFVLLLFAAVVFLFMVYGDRSDTEISDYYLENFAADTGAGNAVAAIYLNYRMYDTIFEALILLASIIAMLHFFRAGGSSDS